MPNSYVKQLVSENSQRSFNLLIAVAFLLIVIPFTFIYLLKIKLPLFFYFILFAIARVIYIIAKAYNNLSLRASQGLEAEELVREQLIKLPAPWKFEANVKLKQLGDLDFFVTSPNNHNFAIEVKSHYGVIVSNQNTLKRKVKGQIQEFEKDFLVQTKLESNAMETLTNQSGIIPVLVFTNASLELDSAKINDVYILTIKDLNNFLLNYTTTLITK